MLKRNSIRLRNKTYFDIWMIFKILMRRGWGSGGDYSPSIATHHLVYFPASFLFVNVVIVLKVARDNSGASRPVPYCYWKSAFISLNFFLLFCLVCRKIVKRDAHKEIWISIQTERLSLQNDKRGNMLCACWEWVLMQEDIRLFWAG